MGDTDVFLLLLFLQLRIALEVVSALRLPLTGNIDLQAKCVVFGSCRQNGKHTSSFVSLFLTVRLWRINDTVDNGHTICALAAI